MDSAIDVGNLTKHYGDLLAVDHISFSGASRRGIWFPRPQRAGKTTSIRMLTGLTRPTIGHAHVLGLDLASDLVHIKKQMSLLELAQLLFQVIARLLPLTYAT